MLARPKIVLKLLLLFALTVASVHAVAADDFPGPEPDRRVLKTQKKVDSLFEKGKYERAMFIYRQELAPLGDKFAQYMVGYMYLAGKGVEKDVASASAWFRLAAQREDPLFVRVRDELWRLLNADQQAQSDQVFIDLRSECGDVTLVAKFLDSDFEILRNQSTVTSLSRSLVDREESKGLGESGQYDQVVERISQRMSYLTQMFADGKLHGADEIKRFEQLSQQATVLFEAHESNN